LILLACCLLTTLAKSGLDIHVFDVGQGDSQLIVFPSGYSILIDAGETSTGSMRCKTIAEKVKSILGKSHVDVAVLTHLHADHVGYPFKSGFWYLLESSGLTFGKFIDRDSGSMTATPSSCDDVDAVGKQIKWNNVGSLSSTGVKWVCYATNSKIKSKLRSIREVAKQCSNQINPPDSGATVDIIVTDAKGVKDNNGVLIGGDHSAESVPPSENDYSISLRIKYGNFVYSTSGDLDGEYSKSGYDYAYHDIETPYKDYIGEVDLFHANHHGSSHSNNANFLATLNPTVSVISCGLGNSYGHPTESALKSMSDRSKKIYITEDCNPSVTDKFSKVVIVNDDIKIHYPTDGSSFTVSDSKGSFSNSYDVKKNKKSPKKCGSV